MLSTVASGGASAPTDDPTGFRENLHQEFTKPISSDRADLPYVLPEIRDPAEKTSLNFGDLPISESVGPANFTQDHATIAALWGGRTVAVWEDNRLGPKSVFLQLFDGDGNAIGGNSALITGGNFNLSSPQVCADSGGNFFVVWREENHGYLQAARFDSLADVITPAFFVSDTTMLGYSGEFDAIAMPDGRLLMAWECYTPNVDIYFQLFAPSGIPSTEAIKANSDGLTVNHWSPTAAASANGDFAVVWEDYRDGYADIFYRRFNSLGLPYASEKSLADPSAPDSGRFLPSLAYSSADGFTAAWIDLRNGVNIYFQRVDASGNLTGSNTLLTAGSSNRFNWEVDLSTTLTGNLLAVWTIYDAENRIMLQRFSGGVQFDGPAQLVSAADSNNRYHPTVAGSFLSQTAIVWTDWQSGSSDIYSASYNDDGSPSQNIFMVNDDLVGSPSTQARAVNFDRYEWSVVFTDMRRDAGDIMLQRVYVGGSLLGANRLINTDPPGGYQSQPAIASGIDQLLISWTDEREGTVSGQNIFCLFSAPHYSLTDEIVVNDDQALSNSHYRSDGAVNTDGEALVVWTDTRTGSPKIYGQLFDPNHQKLGTNFLIGPSSAGIGERARVSVDAAGNFIVAYLNRLNAAGPAVEMVSITTGGSKTNLFNFSSDRSGYQIDGFDAGVNTNDEIILVWHGYKASGSDLFLTVFNFSGVVVSNTAAVTDNLDARPETADLDVDNNDNLLITWLDHRTGAPTPFRQIYQPDFAPLQTNLPVYLSEGPFMQSPATAGFNGKSIFVWSDARENGLTVYGSQEIYDPTDADDNSVGLPARFSLGQNYPNPFNPSTAIQFSLAKGDHVKLNVYNLLGQQVKTLIDLDYPAGNHTVTWDGTDDNGARVASGIYLYRLESGGETFARKMTLLK